MKFKLKLKQCNKKVAVCIPRNVCFYSLLYFRVFNFDILKKIGCLNKVLNSFEKFGTNAGGFFLHFWQIYKTFNFKTRNIKITQEMQCLHSINDPLEQVLGTPLFKKYLSTCVA